MLTYNYIINVLFELYKTPDEVEQFINFIFYICMLPFVIILDIILLPFTILYLIAKKKFNF